MAKHLKLNFMLRMVIDMGLGGFSWKRALGITKVKRKISKKTGIPLTKSGRQRKLGKFLGIK